MEQTTGTRRDDWTVGSKVRGSVVPRMIPRDMTTDRMLSVIALERPMERGMAASMVGMLVGASTEPTTVTKREESMVGWKVPD